jgi:hypothetical protein
MRTNLMLSVLACLAVFAVTRAQQVLPTPQAPPQKLVILTGEPIQFHIKGNGQVWPGQVVKIDETSRLASLIVWDTTKKAWEEHHGIKLDDGDKVYYTLFR